MCAAWPARDLITHIMKLIVSRVGDIFYLGTNDVYVYTLNNCQDPERCVKVEAIEVWVHENFTDDRNNRHDPNNIAIVRLLSVSLCVLFLMPVYFYSLCMCAWVIFLLSLILFYSLFCLKTFYFHQSFCLNCRCICYFGFVAFIIFCRFICHFGSVFSSHKLIQDYLY